MNFEKNIKRIKEKWKLDRNNDDNSNESIRKKANKKNAFIVARIVIQSLDSIPLVTRIFEVIEKINESYEKTIENKKTCAVLIDRIELGRFSVSSLIRRYDGNLDKLKSQSYYKAFQKFLEVLNESLKFIIKIQKKGYLGEFYALTIEEQFKEIIKKFDTVMNDLGFSVLISSFDKICEMEGMMSELRIEFQNFAKHIEKTIENFRQNDEAKIGLIKQHRMDFLNANEDLKVTIIESNRLIESKYIGNTDIRGEKKSVVKRKLKDDILEKDVACKFIDDELNDDDFQTQLAIWKAIHCDYIIEFYGLSKLNSKNVVVLEWAEHGNLKEYYENNDNKLDLLMKLKISFDVCRGLLYMDRKNIYHHDVRCENILINHHLIAKIGNFDLTRDKNGESRKSMGIKTIRWTSPERVFEDHRYCSKCEIFSYGMFLLELIEEQVPYHNIKEDEKVIEYIQGGGKIKKKSFSKKTDLQKKLYEIIKKGNGSI